MKIKITANGYLWVERAGEMKEQICPYMAPVNCMASTCGDWCPMFSEPTCEPTVEEPRSGYEGLSANMYATRLRLCHTVIECAPRDFTDERRKA